MKNKLTGRVLRIGTGLLIFFAIASQLFTLSQYKAFWLDEWFILSNIKFKSYAELFGPLDYIQQFPKIYLVIIKWLAEVTNYNYFALRFFPTAMQILNIFLIVFVISKILYNESHVKRTLFTWFFLALQTTVFYFSQLKQYSMEMFLALMSVYFYYLLSTHYRKLTIKSWQYAGFLVFTFAGLFFSYTFPFVVAPILLSLFLTFVHGRKMGEWDFKALFPLVLFFVAIVLNYFTDLRYVLSNDNQYSNFSNYVMSYDSVKVIAAKSFNIVRLISYNIHYTPENHSAFFGYVLHILKALLIFLTCVGIYVSLRSEAARWRTFKKDYIIQFSFRNTPTWNSYMLVIFFLTIFMYLLKVLPLGQGRLNYYAYIFNTYFLICGLYSIGSLFPKMKVILISAVFFIALSQIVRIYSNEFRNTNLLFDQGIYDNVGKAIESASHDSLPLVVYKNAFHPESILSNTEFLMIRSHHLYKPAMPLKVHVIDSSLIHTAPDTVVERKYIFIKKHSYILKEQTK